MQQVILLPTAFSELFAQVSCSGRLTLADRYGLMAALLEEPPSEEKLAVIDRLLHSVRKGQVGLSNEISVVFASVLCGESAT